MAKSKGEEGDEVLEIQNTGLAALLSEASYTSIRALRLLNKQMENPRVADDPEVAMRAVRLATEATQGIFSTTAGVVDALKDKTGKIPGLTDGNIKQIDAGLEAATMGAAASGGKLGKLAGLTSNAGKN